MGRYNNGWYRLDRRAVFEDIGQNPSCLALWVWLLAMATVYETKLRWRGTQRTIPCGTVVTGYRDLADLTHIAKSTVERQLKYLEQTGRIDIESGPDGTLISICKWREYQVDHQDAETEKEQPKANGIGHVQAQLGKGRDVAEYSNGEGARTQTGHERDGHEDMTETLLNNKPYTTNNKQPTKNKKQDGNRHDSPEGEPPHSPAQQLIAVYCLAWKERYKTAPIIDGPNANAARLITTGKNKIPFQRAIDLVQTYILMNDRWFLTKRHDLITFKTNLNAVAIKHDTGSSINVIQAQDMERADANVQAIREYRNSSGGGHESQG